MAVQNWLSRFSSKYASPKMEEEIDPTLPSQSWYERLRNADTQALPQQGPQPENPIANPFVAPEISPEDDIVARVQKIQAQTAANKAADDAEIMQRSMERRAAIAPGTVGYSDGMNWDSNKLTEYGFSPEEITGLQHGNHADSAIDYFVSQGWLNRPAPIVQDVSYGVPSSATVVGQNSYPEQIVSNQPELGMGDFRQLDSIPTTTQPVSQVNDSGRVLGGYVFGNPYYVKPEQVRQRTARQNKFDERWNNWKNNSKW